MRRGPLRPWNLAAWRRYSGRSNATGRLDLGCPAGLVASPAAVVGGIGNIEGSATGGLLIGIIRAMNERYLSASWSDVVIFAILIIVLVFRPTGLLGMRVPEK